MIRLVNVNYSYDKKKNILNNINLDINSNEITMIIGKNGSGKSTLGNIISNIFELHDGKLYIDDKKIDKHTKNIDIRKKVNILFQNPNNQIIFNKVYDDIKFTLENFKINNNKIDSIIKKSLTQVDMLDHMNSNPYEMSLGQKQKIALASILSINPNYIVFDESTSFLDPKGKEDFYKIIKNLKKDNKGIIFITNNLNEILLADRIIILNNNTIYKDFSKNQLINNLDVFEELDFELPFIIKLLKGLKNINVNFDDIDEDKLIDYIVGNIK